MQPVKVTAWIDSPLAGDPPMLDAILEWRMSFHYSSIAASKNGHRHKVAARPRGFPVSEPGQLPIEVARRKVCGLPIPLCSNPIFRVDHSWSEHFHRSLGPEHVPLLAENERRSIQKTGGKYKSYRLPLRLRAVERIVWFAVCRKAPTTIRKALKDVHYVGKKSQYGYGCVSKWEVEPVEEDWSWYASSGDGPVLMRVLPADHSHPDGMTGYRRGYGAPCPPYWQRDLYREIVTPC